MRLAFAGLHPDRLRSLIEAYGPAGTLRRIERGAIEATPRIRAAVGPREGERRTELARAGIGIVLRGGAGYPGCLAELPDSPPIIFVRGAVPEGPAVAVVGTRRCTEYGKRLAAEYGAAIAATGWCVVSGLARGIDGAAHRGVVAAGGRGVAVLGSGVDVMYPAEHADLARRLVEGGGAVISEYPPGTPPEGWRFPPRNRIISGLASVIVVVEAGVKGGALITAGYALAHGRPVFAVPGDVRRATSEGCNRLIRDGAHPVLDPDDLIAELSLVLGPPAGPGTDDGPTGNSEPGLGMLG